MRLLKTLAWKAMSMINLEASVRLQRNSGLEDEGWYYSYATKRSVDKLGNPLPWYTYSCIHFIESRLVRDHRIFEYGAGNSTIWYGHRVKEIVSVEHDEEWYRILKSISSLNSTIVHRDLDGGYAEEIIRHGVFDILVIDGKDRVGCAEVALESKALASNGIIIWDNSERDDFVEGHKLLRAAGFREIIFEGMGPINTYNWRTSILYRNENCFGI